MEQLPESEFSEAESSLIEKLREKGADDPETHQLLLEWCKKEEAKVNVINTSRASIELDLKKAKLYQAAGFHEEAWSSLAAAWEASHNEGDVDLRTQAEALMDQFDK